jgi:hypothetical protein
MAQSVIGALRVTLGLDSAQFSRDAKRAESTVQRLGSRMQKFGAAMSVVSTGITMAMRGALNAADDAGKLAQKIGLSVESLTRLQYVAELSGVSMQSLQAGVTRLSRAMVDGNKQFEATGIAARDAAGNLRPTEDVLLDLADLFSRMPDGAQKTAIAVGVLGRSGADLIPLLNGGRDAIKGLMDEADALGITISTETFKAAEVFNDSLTRIGAVARGFTRQIAAELAPTMAAIADTIANLAVAFGSLSPEVRTGAAVVVTLTAAIGPLALAIGTLVKSMALFKAGLAVLAGPAGLILLAAAGAIYLAVKVTQLVRALGGFGEAMTAVKEIGAEVFERIGDGAESLRRMFIAAGEGIKAALVGAFASALEAFAGLTDGIASGWNSLMSSIGMEGVATARGIGSDLAASLRLVADEAANASRLQTEAAGVFARSAREPLASLAALRDRLAQVNEETEDGAAAASQLREEIEELESAAGGGGGRSALARVGEDAEEAADAFNPLETAVGSLSQSIGDFFSGSITSFRDFADTLLRGFQSLIADMIATAARNQIMLAIGAGGSAAGTAASAATGGGGALAGIAGALGPAGLAAAAVGGIALGIFGARRRRRQERAARRAAQQQEKDALDAQILDLQGDTEGARARALEGLRPWQRWRQEEIFRLEDQNRVNAEKEDIERRLLELQGDTAELRRRELDALDPANRALAERAFLLEDEARIGAERRGLEERLLQLVGATEELRRREIEALDQSNRGLLRTIFNIEDMTSAFQRLQQQLSARFDLSSKEFLTSFDARMAQAAAARQVQSPGEYAGNDPQLQAMVEAMRKQTKILENIELFGIPGRA